MGKSLRSTKSYSDFQKLERTKASSRSHKNEENGNETGQVLTELDFVEWFGPKEAELSNSSDEEYQLYLDQLRLSESHLDSLLSISSSSLSLLASLSESFKSVESQTTEFRVRCEGLLEEQKQAIALADDLGENLQHYNYLDPITRRLNAPGAGKFVRGKEFSDMLKTLDGCLDYMRLHPAQSEAQTYQSRYRSLLTRALTLIRVHFVISLREVATDVSKRISERQLNENTMSTLLYAKFRVGASDLKSVGQEIRKRAAPLDGGGIGGQAEYQSLMNELYTNYAITRGKLVLPIVRKKIGEIAMAPSTAKELVAFARRSIGYIRGICFDEYELWREWFEGEDGLYEFLESVCEPLYEHLRPRVKHESQLLKLCELCTLLQTRYMQDQEEDSDPSDSAQLNFSSLIMPALKEAQTRLVFKAQAILRDEIQNYRPKPEDLDYPPKGRSTLSIRKKSKDPVMSGRKDSLVQKETPKVPTTPLPKTPVIVDDSEFGVGSDHRWGFEPERTLDDWYPTLRKAIWLLSRIYRLVNSTVFDDLAHQIVHQTTLSLHQAAKQISPKSSPANAQLFLIKHLLILKSQIVAFDIEFVNPHIPLDFSNMATTFWELLSRGTLFNPRDLMRFVSDASLLPRVVNNMVDAKSELDGRLRTVINDFTISAAARMTASIASSATQARSFDAHSAMKALSEGVQREVPLLRSMLDNYIDDLRTKEALVRAVLDQVMGNYETFSESFRQAAREAIGKGKGAGNGEEDALWDLETFAEWAEGVFKVGVVVDGNSEGKRRASSESSGS
ncbi:MAG: Golgi transport complex subunit 3 [Trizodia sp. TS-e1964]|nr:MAG: Golgi transport complex subunit 3 [Trizodia sp. TS-e1964]